MTSVVFVGPTYDCANHRNDCAPRWRETPANPNIYQYNLSTIVCLLFTNWNFLSGHYNTYIYVYIM